MRGVLLGAGEGREDSATAASSAAMGARPPPGREGVFLRGHWTGAALSPDDPAAG